MDTPDAKGYPFATLLASGTITSIESIDKRIEAKLKNWDMNRLQRVDLAIMRISVYELLYEPDVPASITINEAIKLAKEYCAPESYKFINGILDSIQKDIK